MPAAVAAVATAVAAAATTAATVMAAAVVPVAAEHQTGFHDVEACVYYADHRILSNGITISQLVDWALPFLVLTVQLYFVLRRSTRAVEIGGGFERARLLHAVYQRFVQFLFFEQVLSLVLLLLQSVKPVSLIMELLLQWSNFACNNWLIFFLFQSSFRYSSQLAAGLMSLVLSLLMTLIRYLPLIDDKAEWGLVDDPRAVILYQAIVNAGFAALYLCFFFAQFLPWPVFRVRPAINRLLVFLSGAYTIWSAGYLFRLAEVMGSTCMLAAAKTVGYVLLTLVLVWVCYADTDIERRRENRLFNPAEWRGKRRLRINLDDLLRDPDIAVIPQESLELEQEPFDVGGFGAVYRGRWGLQDVAVKKMLLTTAVTPEAVREFLMEIRFLSRVRHDNIVKFLGIVCPTQPTTSAFAMPAFGTATAGLGLGAAASPSPPGGGASTTTTTSATGGFGLSSAASSARAFFSRPSTLWGGGGGGGGGGGATGGGGGPARLGRYQAVDTEIGTSERGRQQREQIWLVTEFMPNRSLRHVLHEYELSLSQKLKLALDIATGMNFLHSLRPPLIHRDLKLENCLLDQHGSCKVGDFGSTTLKAQTMTPGLVGTLHIMPPEVFDRTSRYTEKIDVYSFGILLAELCGRDDYSFAADLQRQCSMDIETIELIRKGVRPAIPESWPRELVELAQSCWQLEPRRRPSFEVICETLRRILVRLDGTAA